MRAVGELKEYFSNKGLTLDINNNNSDLSKTFTIRKEWDKIVCFKMSELDYLFYVHKPIDIIEYIISDAIQY